MAIPKESFYLNKALGFGRVAENDANNNIKSYAAEGDDIEFGKAVRLGTDGVDQVKIFDVATGTFKGVAVYSTDASNIDNSKFNENDSVPILNAGVVTVYTEEAITAVNQDVRVRFDATGKGNFRTTADAGNTVQITDGAEWRGIGASGTAVKLYLSPPFTLSAD